MLFKISIILLAIVLIGTGAWFGRKVPFSEQWPMFEALRTTAAIIFAVIGAWMAIIFPERLKQSFRPLPKGESLTQSTGWGQLFTPVVHSTLILSVVFLIGIIVPALRHTHLSVSVEIWRGSSYAMLVALTLWQLWTVLLTLIPSNTVKTSFDAADARAETIAGLMAVGQRHKKDRSNLDS